mmetsp:Transcript_1091/g.3016  ORF Transcript_1091/g.3016 Transcript_1091/m.3016 type:complete len:329 (-) Transcript_1091:49-1035(-)
MVVERITNAAYFTAPVLLALLAATITTLALFKKSWRKALRFVVRAQTNGALTNAAAAVSRAVLGPLLAKAPLTAPSRIRVSRVGAHAVSLEFKADVSRSKFFAVPTYEVALKGRNLKAELKRPEAAVADEDGFWLKISGRGTAYRLKDLYDDETYVMRVRAVNRAGPGPWSAEVPFYTRQEATAFGGGVFDPGRHGGRADGAEGTAVYEWTQEKTAVCVRVALPKGVTRGRQLEVDIRPSALRVAVYGGATLVAGDLYAAVKPDECTWEIEEASGVPSHCATKGAANLVLYLEKVKHDDREHRGRWIGLIQGHNMVDFNFQQKAPGSK